MEGIISSHKDLLDVLIEVLVVVIPVVLTWFIRTYVRGSAAERDLAAIVRLSNAAIDYVENLDKRGELDLPPELSKGAHKLKLAGEWLESELKRAGIKITDQEAQNWIASEFQKRVGDVRMVGTIAELTSAAVDLIQGLEERGMVALSPEVDRIAYLAELAADWIVAELAKHGASISRAEALTWARAELLHRLQTEMGDLPDDERLARLAKQAVAFLQRLKASGQLAIRSALPGADVETDVAMAWLLTETARQGLAVSTDQIAEAVSAALGLGEVESAKGL